MKGNASTSLMKVLIKGTPAPSSSPFNSPIGSSSSQTAGPSLASPVGVDTYSCSLEQAASFRAGAGTVSPLASNASLVSQSQQRQGATKRQQAGRIKSQTSTSSDTTIGTGESDQEAIGSIGCDIDMNGIGTKFALTMLGLNNPNRLNKSLIQKVNIHLHSKLL